MNGFKRLCLIIYSVSGLCALSALVLTWVGPWTAQARGLLEVRWYFYGLLVMVGITFLGLIVTFLRALFTPRAAKETVIATIDGGTISVTRNAVIAQAKNIVEEDGVCKATSVKAQMRKKGYVRVWIRVKPLETIDVMAYSDDLHRRLDEGLRKVCGDAVKSIDIAFVEPTKKAYAEEKAEEAASEETIISVDPSTMGKENAGERKGAGVSELARRDDRLAKRGARRDNSAAEGASVLRVKPEVLGNVSGDAASIEDVEDVEPEVVAPEASAGAIDSSFGEGSDAHETDVVDHASQEEAGEGEEA